MYSQHYHLRNGKEAAGLLRRRVLVHKGARSGVHSGEYTFPFTDKRDEQGDEPPLVHAVAMGEVMASSS